MRKPFLLISGDGQSHLENRLETLNLSLGHGSSILIDTRFNRICGHSFFVLSSVLNLLD